MIDGKHVLERAAEICRVSRALVDEARAMRRAFAAVQEREHDRIDSPLALTPPATAEPGNGHNRRA